MHLDYGSLSNYDHWECSLCFFWHHKKTACNTSVALNTWHNPIGALSSLSKLSVLVDVCALNVISLQICCSAFLPLVPALADNENVFFYTKPFCSIFLIYKELQVSRCKHFIISKINTLKTQCPEFNNLNFFPMVNLIGNNTILGMVEHRC